jgi:peptide/nickel transport system ATP-binding protein
MVFQEPMTSLNPSLTIGSQLVETAMAHGSSRSDSRGRALELLERVGLEAQESMRQYPHELSGGMRQRVMIAIALMNRPKLLIADEPTTALDVTVQAAILRLIHELQKELGMAVLLITHDLGVVAEICETVSVMYAGLIVESAPANEIFANPRHPYTRDLLASLPSRQKRGQDLLSISGAVPDPVNWPSGCRYAERCSKRFEPCSRCLPPAIQDGPAKVCCHLFEPAEVAQES